MFLVHIYKGQPRCSTCLNFRDALLCVIVLISAHVHCENHHQESDQNKYYYEAKIKYTYNKDPKLHKFITEQINGKYGTGYQPANTSITGKLLHITSPSKKDKRKFNHFGCTTYSTKLPSEKWIALVERGECDFTQKLRMATVNHNASAVVVYDNNISDDIMRHRDVNKNTAVFISRSDGQTLIALLKKEIKVEIEIHIGLRHTVSEPEESNNSSALYLSIAFSIVVIIAVAWLMSYYIRKLRYSHAKERLAKRLARAAKKAIAKIPQRTISAGDKELEGDFDQCAICIEPYKDGDIIRLMPCRHVFHKSCVDPWLLDHRTCPMCKLDILQAFGMSMGKLDMLAYGIQGSQESMHRDPEAAAIMLESIPSGDGAGRSQSAALIVDDQEASSSLDDDVLENAEVQVVLVPHSCLHFHHHNSRSRPTSGVLEEEEEEDVELESSEGLLASGNVNASSSAWGDIERGRKFDPTNRRISPSWSKADSTNSVEMKALVHPSREGGEGQGYVEMVEDRDNYCTAFKTENEGEESGIDSAEPQTSKITERKSSDSAQSLVTDDSAEPNSNAKQSDV